MRRTLVGALVSALALVPSLTFAGTGVPDTTFGTAGVVAVDFDSAFDVTVDHLGRTIVAGVRSGQITVARYTESGALDPTFTGDGIVSTGINAAGPSTVADVAVLSDLSIVVIGETRTSSDPFSNSLFAAKLSVDGVPVAGYGTGGTALEFLGFTSFRPNGSIAPDGSAVMAQSALGNGYVATVSATGVFTIRDLEYVASAAPAGCLPQTVQNTVAGAAAVSATEYVVVTNVPLLNCGSIDTGIFVTKVALPGNTPVWSRVILPPEVAGDPAQQNQAAIIGTDVLVATTQGTTSHIHRFALSDGTPAASWGTNGRATVADGFGRIGAMAANIEGRVSIVSEAASTSDTVYVDQLAANGADDPNFTRVSIPAIDIQRATSIDADSEVVVLVNRSTGTTLRRFVGVQYDAASVEPVRLLDTRPTGTTVDGLYQGIGRASAGSVTKVRIAGRGGVPNDAKAALLNLTMPFPSAPGYGAIYPCTPTPPTASNVNYTDGSVVANSVTALLDANGDVCVFTVADSDILIDLTGFVPAGAGVGAITPARLVDTRIGQPTVDGRFQGLGRSAGIRKFKIAGRADIPADATSVVLNLTMISPAAAGFATIYPCDPTPPAASNINYTAGAFIANSVTAKLDANGDVCVFTLAETDYAIDASAYVAAGASVASLTPARLLDTRPGQPTTDGLFAGSGRVPRGTTIKVRAAGRGGVPLGATAVIVNLTAVSPSSLGFLTIYPCTPFLPNVSSLNYTPGAFVANGVTAKLDAAGDVCIRTLADTDILLDVNGYLP